MVRDHLPVLAGLLGSRCAGRWGLVDWDCIPVLPYQRLLLVERRVAQGELQPGKRAQGVREPRADGAIPAHVSAHISQLLTGGATVYPGSLGRGVSSRIVGLKPWTSRTNSNGLSTARMANGGLSYHKKPSARKPIHTLNASQDGLNRAEYVMIG